MSGGAVPRAGTAADEPAVRELCERIWPGTDHVPWYWGRQVRDPAARPAVIEVDGRLAALAILDLLPDSAWWHSVRVAPDFRRQGLAARLLRHHLDECRSLGLPRLRYATTCANDAMHRLAASEGLRHAGTWRYVCAGGLPVEPGGAREGGARPLTPADAAALERFLADAGARAAGGRLFCAAWTWRDFTADLVRGMLDAGTAYGCDAGGRLEAVALTGQEREPDYTWFFLGWIGGTERGVAELGRHLRAEAANAKPDGDEEYPALGMAPDEPVVVRALAEAGWRREPDEDMDVFEKDTRQAR